MYIFALFSDVLHVLNQGMDCVYGLLNQLLFFLKLNTAVFFQPIRDSLPAFGVHAMMINLLKCSWNKQQRQWIDYLMNFVRNNKEPFFAPYSCHVTILPCFTPVFYHSDQS